MKNDYTIRRETSADYNEVENLTRRRFGTSTVRDAWSTSSCIAIVRVQTSSPS